MQVMRTHVPFKFWLLYTSQNTRNTTMLFFLVCAVEDQIPKSSKGQKITSWVQTLTRTEYRPGQVCSASTYTNEINYVLYDCIKHYYNKHYVVRDRNWWKGAFSDCLDRNSIQKNFNFNKTLLSPLLRFFFFWVCMCVFLFLRDCSQKVDSPNDGHTQREESAFLLN